MLRIARTTPRTFGKDDTILLLDLSELFVRLLTLFIPGMRQDSILGIFGILLDKASSASVQEAHGITASCDCPSRSRTRDSLQSRLVRCDVGTSISEYELMDGE